MIVFKIILNITYKLHLYVIIGNEEQITIKKRIIAEEGIGLPICHYIYICMYLLSSTK